MKKRFFFNLFLLAAFCFSCTNEEHELNISDNSTTVESETYVSMEEAEAELFKFLQAIDSPTRGNETHSRKISSRFTIGLPTRSTDEEIEPCLHFVNFENNGGYAILSGDSRVESVLAVTNSGSVIPDNPDPDPGLKITLPLVKQHYIDVVKEVPTDEVPQKIYSNWKEDKIVENLCKVKWGQHAPYNNKTPKTRKGQTLAGCVATAVAQFMSVYRYPETYKGYTFDWMLLTQKTKISRYDDSDSIACEQVSFLMRRLGDTYNLDMNYGVESSSAQSKHIPRTLRNFGYSNGGKLEDYNIETIKNELSNRYCCLVCGYENETFGIGHNGHQWLIHGLFRRMRDVTTYYSDGQIDHDKEIEYYVQCNWGWDGISDGYFLSGIFDSRNPVYNDQLTGEGMINEDAYNFRYKFKMVTGIRK